MLQMVIKSDRDVLVDGIGLLPAGEDVELTDEQLRDFKMRNGVGLTEANFPPYVTVTVVLSE